MATSGGVPLSLMATSGEVPLSLIATSGEVSSGKVPPSLHADNPCNCPVFLQGTCSCNKGWYGDDCTIRQSVAPQVRFLHEDNLCDWQEQECSYIEVTIEGEGFLKELQPYCHFQQVGGRPWEYGWGIF